MSRVVRQPRPLSGVSLYPPGRYRSLTPADSREYNDDMAHIKRLIGRPPKPVAERLWKRVRKTRRCWLWTGGKIPPKRGRTAGYGVVWKDGRTKYVHRVAYELLVGPIPNGLTIDHMCGNPLCVKPTHLQPLPIRDNILRGTNPAAENARKAHCKRGHPFDATTPGRYGRPDRACRTCQRLSYRKHRRRRGVKLPYRPRLSARHPHRIAG